MRALLSHYVCLAAVAALGCSAPRGKAISAVTMTTAATPTAATIPRAILPGPPAPLAPAQTELSGSLTGEILTETESCAGCHADAAAQWRSSAHAFGSFNNPVYRFAVDRFRSTTGKEASRFCAGCHDVALLVDGAMSGEVTPVDSRAHGGVTCRVCHGIESARPDGNGSYTLASSPIPIPRDGDDASLSAHKARMALAPLRTPALCGTCHRAFLSHETGNPAHLVGQDEIGAWRRSAFAGSLAARIDEPVARADCRACHMPLEDAPRGDAAAKLAYLGGATTRKIHSHRFAGGQSWLAAMRGDKAQLEAVRAMLQGAASIDIAIAVGADGSRTMPADGAAVSPGLPMTFDVVVRNERVGHRFPGGVLDAQDTWIELEVIDARGRQIAQAGTTEEASDDDPTAHVLRAIQADEGGRPLLLRETNRFRATVYNHTIAPRDAEVVRYRFETLASLDADALPLRVDARLRHRSRNLALAHASCAESRTPRGLGFAREVKTRTNMAMDPCVAEPVTDVATSEVWIGEGWQDRTLASTMPAWRRMYDDALGLLRSVQEDVDDARPILERASELAPPGDDRARAIVIYALAQVATREGRTDEALGYLREAELLAPGEPAILHARGAALGDVWRWKEATEPLARAAEASPLDDLLLSHLAVAYGSADEPIAALGAVARGLALSPRDSDMLRVQVLALERIGAPHDDAARAREAFASWRPPDDAPAIKSACAKGFAWCALERVPVHVHVMRTVP
jgi:tetratricopeptide (TPR) repeat protein